jgi:hypothetical protein
MVRSQSVAFENVYSNKSYTIYPGAKVWVQTYDDPEGYFSTVFYQSFDGTNFNFQVGMGRSKNVISIPISHISNIYIPESSTKLFLNGLCLGASFTVAFIGGLTMVLSAPIGSAIILCSIPILRYGILKPSKIRLHMPHHEITIGRNR